MEAVKEGKKKTRNRRKDVKRDANPELVRQFFKGNPTSRRLAARTGSRAKAVSSERRALAN